MEFLVEPWLYNKREAAIDLLNSGRIEEAKVCALLSISDKLDRLIGVIERTSTYGHFTSLS